MEQAKKQAAPGGEAEVVKLPTGVIMDRESGDTKKASSAMVKLVVNGWKIKRELDRLKEELALVNEKLINKLGPGMTVQIPGLCRISVSQRQRVKIMDDGRLREVLGPRFDDLVRVVTRYEPEKKLVTISSDGDDPLAPSVRECLGIDHSTSVTWRAEK